MQRRHRIVPYFFCALLSVSCVEKSVEMYAIPEGAASEDQEHVASFYGTTAQKACESYRKLYAGVCDTSTLPYVSCVDINDKKYKLTSCK